jgi:hypothetical protein
MQQSVTAVLPNLRYSSGFIVPTIPVAIMDTGFVITVEFKQNHPNNKV